MSYVGADYFDSGSLAGDLLEKMTNRSKKFAIITDELDTSQMIQKRKGFESYLKSINYRHQFQHMKIDHNNIENTLYELKDNFSELDGIYVACGALSEVANLLKSIDTKCRPILVGHDMSQEIYNYLQSEVVTATICQDPVFQGSLAVRIPFNHLMLEQPVKNAEHIVKLEIVTKANAKYYLH
ncbi:lACI-family transcription regulator [Gracilibacillus boraciitolerans JCM 21714]|uniref:LACI-family transcription regulator n=1 Tax=Gracilibacillus boraciitolerans JCM 21714 TaxID=1298598 RepID=W4VH87_9BACI|nr:lACI-family transcription regulator [Gracilibacillus boraciitolerans JCM 21714]